MACKGPPTPALPPSPRDPQVAHYSASHRPSPALHGAPHCPSSPTGCRGSTTPWRRSPRSTPSPWCSLVHSSPLQPQLSVALFTVSLCETRNRAALLPNLLPAHSTESGISKVLKAPCGTQVCPLATHLCASVSASVRGAPPLWQTCHAQVLRGGQLAFPQVK